MQASDAPPCRIRPLNPLGRQRISPDTGNTEMWETALQEVPRTAPLLPPEEGWAESLFLSVLLLTQWPAVITLSKKEQFPFPPGCKARGLTVSDTALPHTNPRHTHR